MQCWGFGPLSDSVLEGQTSQQRHQSFRGSTDLIEWVQPCPPPYVCAKRFRVIGVFLLTDETFTLNEPSPSLSLCSRHGLIMTNPPHAFMRFALNEGCLTGNCLRQFLSITVNTERHLLVKYLSFTQGVNTRLLFSSEEGEAREVKWFSCDYDSFEEWNTIQTNPVRTFVNQAHPQSHSASQVIKFQRA